MIQKLPQAQRVSHHRNSVTHHAEKEKNVYRRKQATGKPGEFKF